MHQKALRAWYSCHDKKGKGFFPRVSHHVWKSPPLPNLKPIWVTPVTATSELIRQQ